MFALSERLTKVLRQATPALWTDAPTPSSGLTLCARAGGVLDRRTTARRVPAAVVLRDPPPPLTEENPRGRPG